MDFFTVEQVEHRDGRVWRARDGWKLQVFATKIYCIRGAQLCVLPYQTKTLKHVGQEAVTDKEIEEALTIDMIAQNSLLKTIANLAKKWYLKI
jgi:hypothetical protein